MNGLAKLTVNPKLYIYDELFWNIRLNCMFFSNGGYAGNREHLLTSNTGFGPRMASPDWRSLSIDLSNPGPYGLTHWSEDPGIRTKNPGQKPPGHKPPDKKPLDKNPPCQNPPGQNPPRQNL